MFFIKYYAIETALPPFFTSPHVKEGVLNVLDAPSAIAVELIVIEANGTAYLSEFGEVRSGVSLGTFDASISTGTLTLTWTPLQSATTLKLVRTLI